MEGPEIYLPIQPTGKRGFKSWLYRTVITEKLYNLTGILLFLLSAIVVAVGISRFGVLFAAAVAAVFIGIPVMVAFVMYPVFGIVVTTTVAYFLFFIGRLGIDFPLGTVMDVLQVMLMLGFFIKIKPKKDWSRLQGAVSFVLLVWVGYNILQVLNPVAESQLAWLYTIRSVAIISLTYFVFVYQVNSIRVVRVIIKTWLVLSMLAALYAFKQEFIGFSDNEQIFVSDPGMMDLLFIDGHWRKFSLFSDPVVFSYNMAVSSILCVALLIGPVARWKKMILLLSIPVYLFAMLFSGTRGAFVLLPAALALLAVIKFNIRVFIATIVIGAAFAVLVFMPTSNPALYRFQSAFRPNEDLSYLVRKANQKRIQPYILSHPFGGGLGSVGAWGQRFAPNSYLAHFPPDSGYVRVAVELGWAGLLLFCTLMFTILYTGIRNYYRIRDPELKMYALAMVLIVFAFNLGNFPQEALVQYPDNLYFYMTVALITVLYRLDKRKSSSTGHE